MSTICSNDLSAPLVAIGGTAKKLVGDPCLDAPALADASPDPGLQPACEVIDVRDSAPRDPRSPPSCASGSTDCYEIVSDAALHQMSDVKVTISASTNRDRPVT